MSMREQILKKVSEDLLKLKYGNGYELNYTNFNKGNLSDIKNFPTVCYDLSGETSEQRGESNYQQIKRTDLIFWIYVSEFKDKGRIVEVREQAINDLTKFIMKSNSITDAGTEDWKVLRLDRVIQATSTGNAYLNDYRISNINHNTDYSEGKAVIEFTVNISYLDFSDSINNYSI